MLNQAEPTREKMGHMKLTELKGLINSLRQEISELESSLSGVIRVAAPQEANQQKLQPVLPPVITEIALIADDVNSLITYIKDIRKRLEF